MGLSGAVSLPSLHSSQHSRRQRPAKKTKLPPLTKDKQVPLSEICEFGDPRAALRTVADLEEKLGVQRFSQVASQSLAIHAAVRSGRAALVRHLLQRGFNPNLAAPDGRTPLFCAVELIRHNTTTAQLQHPGRNEVLEILLGAKANPNAVVAALRETPLDAAARLNNEDMVGQLLAAGAMPTKHTHTKASSRELQRRLPRAAPPRKSRGSSLQQLCQARLAEIKALFRLYVEGEGEDLLGKDWAVRVVSAEGNFATLRVKLGPATYYLACQQDPLVVTADSGMTVFEEGS